MDCYNRTKIILNGCFGKMGIAIRKLAGQDPETEIAAGIDTAAGEGPDFPVCSDINNCLVPADVLIDVSNYKAIHDLLRYGLEKKMPLVICTTGHSAGMLKDIQAASGEIPVLLSANMSIGINLFVHMLERAAKLLYDTDFDIEIIEKHHNQKIDAPSGTALMLAKTIDKALGGGMKYVTDRSRVHEKRKRDEIGLHALRGGSIVGEHSVVFAGQDERIEFTHIAQNRDVFAVGALKAAKYLKGKNPGLYTMQDLINET